MAGIGSNILLNVQARFSGAAATQQARAFRNEITGITHQLNAQGAATAGLGRTSVVASRQYSKSMQHAAQSTFRYTFYALMAMRVGQALISKVFIGGMTKAAKNYESSWAKIKGVLWEYRDTIKDLQQYSSDLAMTTPFGVLEISSAVLAAARAGLDAQGIKSATANAANLATLAEIGLGDATKNMIVTARMYNMEMERAGEMTSMFAYFANKGQATAADFTKVLGVAGQAAGAYGQDIAQTLQLTQALVSAGVEVGRAGTLQRTLYSRATNPDVQEMLQAGLAFAGRAPLYDEFGNMQNIGAAFVDATAMLEDIKQQAIARGQGAQAGSAIDALILELFGIRQGQGFLAVGRYSQEEYAELYNDNWASTLSDADKSLKERLDEIHLTLEWSNDQWAASMENLNTTLGTPINTMIRPFVQAGTEIVVFTNAMISSNDTAMSLIPTMMALGAAIIGISGLGGIAAGVFFILRTRMADVGRETMLIMSNMTRLRRMGYFRGVSDATLAVQPHRVGFAYIKSFARTPLKVLGGVALLGGMVAYAWKKNLWNLKERTQEFTSWWKDSVGESGTVGKRMYKWWYALTHYSSNEGTEGYTGRLNPKLKAFTDIFQPGGYLEKIGYGFGAVFKVVGRIFTDGIWPVVKLVYKGFFGIIKGMAWLRGFGNTQRGFEAFARGLGKIIALGLMWKAAKGIWAVGTAIQWLLTKMGSGVLFKSVKRMWSIMIAERVAYRAAMTTAHVPGMARAAMAVPLTGETAGRFAATKPGGTGLALIPGLPAVRSRKDVEAALAKFPGRTGVSTAVTRGANGAFIAASTTQSIARQNLIASRLNKMSVVRLGVATKNMVGRGIASTAAAPVALGANTAAVMAARGTSGAMGTAGAMFSMGAMAPMMKVLLPILLGAGLIAVVVALINNASKRNMAASYPFPTPQQPVVPSNVFNITSTDPMQAAQEVELVLKNQADEETERLARGAAFNTLAQVSA